tara:strand:- start:428 stop:724 length:297 start_codon:yes stop_codon:yes gene_type:complete
MFFSRKVRPQIKIPKICEKYNTNSTLIGFFLGICVLSAVAFVSHYNLLNSELFKKKVCEKYQLMWILSGFMFSIFLFLILLQIFGRFDYIYFIDDYFY